MARAHIRRSRTPVLQRGDFTLQLATFARGDIRDIIMLADTHANSAVKTVTPTDIQAALTALEHHSGRKRKDAMLLPAVPVTTSAPFPKPVITEAQIGNRAQLLEFEIKILFRMMIAVNTARLAINEVLSPTAEVTLTRSIREQQFNLTIENIDALVQLIQLLCNHFAAEIVQASSQSGGAYRAKKAVSISADNPYMKAAQLNQELREALSGFLKHVRFTVYGSQKPTEESPLLNALTQIVKEKLSIEEPAPAWQTLASRQVEALHIKLIKLIDEQLANPGSTLLDRLNQEKAAAGK